MLGQSYYLRGEMKKLSKEEQKAGNQLFLCVVGVILLTGVIFFVGQFFKVWNDNRSISMEQMQIDDQVLFAQGQIERVLPTQEAVYFVTSSQETKRMLRKLPSWTVVKPEPVLSAGEQLLGMNSTGEQALLRQQESYYLRNLQTGEQEEISLAEEELQGVRASFCTDGKKLIVETQGQDTHVLWQWDLEEKTWTSLGSGNHAEYSPDGKSLYYEREGTVWRLDLKEGREEAVTEGYLPTLADKGNYLAYVDGQNQVRVCNVKRPEETFVLTQLAQKKELAWERDAAALYVVETAEASGQAEVRYYTLRNGTGDVASQAATWLEACMTGNQEVVERIYPEDPHKEEMKQLQTEGLGFYAPEKEGGLEGSGMYQRFRYQVQEEDRYESWSGKLYFHAGDEGYQLERYLTRDQAVYTLEKGQVYKQDAEGKVPVGAPVSDALWCAYNPGHDDVMLIRGKAGEYMATMINEGEKSLDLVLTMPQEQEAYAVSFSRSGHVGALFYQDGENQGILILNLKKNQQIPSEFLEDVEKAFWRNDQLIVYSGDEQLKVRWVYAPSEGTLQLHE